MNKILKWLVSTLNKKNSKVVIDPVIACKGTAQILQPKSVEDKNDLLPLALVATPNLIEAGILSGLGEISSVAEMEEAAKQVKWEPSMSWLKGHRSW